MNPALSWSNEKYSARRIPIEFDSKQELHEHWNDHVLVCTKGPVRVEYETGHAELSSGDALFIPADRKHAVIALNPEGGEIRCVFGYLMVDGVTRENFDKNK